MLMSGTASLQTFAGVISLLNDFRLSIPVEEIEAYGTMLVEFYAREVIAQQRAAAEAMSDRSLSESSSESTSTIRAAS